MNDSIGLYLNDIGKVPLLTAEDERELSRRIEEGREAAEKLANGKRSAELKAKVASAAEAKDRFIRSNLRLVVSIARRYPLPQGMDLLDLIQEGNLGLEHAVDKFDWRRGFKFSTSARPSAVRSTRRPASSVFPVTAQRACAPHFVKHRATVRPSTRRTLNFTDSPHRSASTRPSATTVTPPLAI
jgi:hypothetical protein